MNLVTDSRNDYFKYLINYLFREKMFRTNCM